MDFQLNELQTMLKNSVARYLEKEYSPEAQARTTREYDGFSERHWATFAQMGWLAASLPEEAGGFGGGATEAAIIMEEFGRALVVEPFLAVGVLAAQTLVHAGGDLAGQLAKAIAGGERRVVLAHGEAAARGRVAHVATTVTARGGRHILNGCKTTVLGAPFADSLIVTARSEGGIGDANGISMFLVPAGAAGLTMRPIRLADGPRAAEVLLEDVAVDAATASGEPGKAFAAIDHGTAHAIIALCAEAIGAMDKALWTTRDYVQTRKQFGQSIGSFQSIQHRMADMLIELELARSTLFRALAHIEDDPMERAHAIAVAKVQVGKSAKFVGGQAIQLHGAIGVTEEYVIGRYFKRLTLLDNLFGPVQHHLETIARTA